MSRTVKRLNITLAKKQQGVVLVIALVILITLTLIGIASLDSTSMDEKIAGNLRDLNLAFQAAESTMAEAENMVEGLEDTSTFGASAGLYDSNPPDPYAASTWTGSSSATAVSNLGSNVIQTRYFVEYVGDFNPGQDTVNVLNYGQGAGGISVSVFRIISRSTGAGGTTQVILESYYGKQF